MGLGQVDYVDEVALAGPVGGGIVVPEDRKALALPYGGLRDERHQVVRDAPGEFTDQSGRMGADRIEVPQRDPPKLRIRLHGVPEDVLAHLLGVAVGRGGFLPRGRFGDGQFVRVPVDRSRGREQDVPAAVGARRVDHVHERVKIVPVVLQRLRHRLSDGLEAGEMDHRVDLPGGEQDVGRHRVAEIKLDERDVIPPCYLLHSFETGQVAVGHVVGHDHVVACLYKFHGHVASDESGPAGHKNALFHVGLSFELANLAIFIKFAS